MSIGEFLKDLPCYNEENFSLFNTEHGIRTSVRRPSIYLPTEDIPSEQLIVSEKKNILLRYLQFQWDNKGSGSRKRNGHDHIFEGPFGKKRFRSDRTDDQ